MPNIPQRLKELRKEFKLTQADVAKILNISESAYGYYEQGRNEISISGIQKLAEKYVVSVAYILCESEIKHPQGLAKHDNAESLGYFNDPELEMWYKELPKYGEQEIRNLRTIWEMIKNENK